jgi:glycosyltransferase involved in cell wall biosynthesis
MDWSQNMPRVKGADILIITGDYPPTLKGVGDYSCHVARALARRGGNVEVLTTATSGIPSPDLDSDHLAIHRDIRTWTFSDLPRVFSLLKTQKEAIVNIQYYCPTTYRRHLMINFLPAIIRCAFRHVRTVVTMHGFWEQSHLYRLRCLPMLRAAHGIVFVDRKNTDLLRLFAGKHVAMRWIPISGNIPPIPCDSRQRLCCRQELGIEPNQVVVAFFGGIARIKGFEYLVHAIERVRNTENLPVTLLAIGGFHADGVNREYQKGIAELIAQSARGSWIKVVSSPPPTLVSRLLHASDIGAFPFINGVAENSGSTLAALQHGLPTITTRGTAQMPEPFGTLAVPARDVNSLADAISRLARSEALRVETGRRSMEAMSHFTWDAIAESLLSFFAELVGTTIKPSTTTSVVSQK